MNLLINIVGFTIAQIIFINFSISLLKPKLSIYKTYVIFILIIMVPQVFFISNLDKLLVRNIVGTVTMIFSFAVLFEDRLNKKVVVFALTYAIAFLSEIVGYLIAKNVIYFNFNNINELSIKRLSLQGFIYILMYIFSLIIINIYKKKKRKFFTKYSMCIGIYILVQIALIYVVYVVIAEFRINSKIIEIIMVLIVIASVFIGWILFMALEISSLKKGREGQLKNDIILRDRHFNELKTQYLEYKKLRHDFYDHIEVISELKLRGDETQLNSYIEEVKSKMVKLDNVIFCKNQAVDALLFNKDDEAREIGIKTSYSLVDLENSVLSDMDLCSIISNLMQNAIRGASEFDGEDKYIHLESYNKLGQLVIVIRNSSNFVDYSIKTTKIDKNAHGLGIGIIKDIAQKNNGNAIFKYENSEFISIVNFKVPFC